MITCSSVSPSSTEFLASRDLARILQYTNYRHFEQVMTNAETACSQSSASVDYHFVDADEMVEIGSGAKRQVISMITSESVAAEDNAGM